MPGHGPVLVARDPGGPAGDGPSAAEVVARRLASAFEGLVTADVAGTDDPTARILKEARDEEAAVVVVPKGRFRWAGTPRALEGPGRCLARRSGRPVLLVPDDAEWPSPPVFGVATDFSEPARRAIDWTLDLAAALDARVCLFHAPEPPELPADAPPYVTRDWMDAAVRERADERLDDLARELAAESPVEIDTRRTGGGTAAEAVAESAGREALCLLCVGSLGLGPARDRLLGPTAEGILSRYRGTVAVVPGSPAPARNACRGAGAAFVADPAAEPHRPAAAVPGGPASHSGPGEG